MATTRRPLITERDVRAAARAGQHSLDVRGATVTPSAMDAARLLHVILDGLPEPSGSAVSRARTKHHGERVTRAPAPSAPPAAAAKRIVLGADHGGVGMKDAVLAALRAKGHTVEDVGTFGSEAVDYPDFAVAVARAVATGRAELGIMIDGAGIGSCMVANKVPGIRAALCHDVTTAANAREHNDANVLTLGGTLIGNRLALEIVTTFLGTAFGGGRHEGRVAKIRALDAAGGKA